VQPFDPTSTYPGNVEIQVEGINSMSGSFSLKTTRGYSGGAIRDHDVAHCFRRSAIAPPDLRQSEASVEFRQFPA
jgi:hypothetical protein